MALDLLGGEGAVSGLLRKGGFRAGFGERF